MSVIFQYLSREICMAQPWGPPFEFHEGREEMQLKGIISPFDKNKEIYYLTIIWFSYLMFLVGEVYNNRACYFSIAT